MTEKRKMLTYKDVQLKFLLKGREALDEMRSDITRSLASGTLKRFTENPDASKEQVADFRDWVYENYGVTSRGRYGPRPGEKRPYKVQSVKNAPRFIRLPVETLGVDKGSLIEVEFGEDEIITRPFGVATVPTDTPANGSWSVAAA